MNNFNTLFEQLINKKRQGNYIDALIIAGNILEIDNNNAEIYYTMGKLYFLMNDYFASIKHYLISLNLDIIDIYNDNNKISGFNVLLKDIPDNILKKLNSINEKSKYMLFKRNALIHIGHSCNEILNIDFPPQHYKNIYIDMLKGIDIELEQKMQYLQDNYFFMLGVDFALNTIDFEIDKQMVKNIYFNKDENQYKDLIRKLHEKIIKGLDNNF